MESPHINSTLDGMLEILDQMKNTFNNSVVVFLAFSTQLQKQAERSKRARFGRDKRPPERPIKEGMFLTPTITTTQIQSLEIHSAPRATPTSPLNYLRTYSVHC